MLEYMNCLALRPDGRELRRRGTAEFPCSVYRTVLSSYAGWEVPWHWHDEIEIKLLFEGTAVASCEESTLLLHPGEGLFMNAHVLHHTRGMDGQNCILGSIVFELPLLAGSAGSIFESRYLQPVYGNPDLPFVPLSDAVPWQARALRAVRAAYDACAEEAFGYELEVRNGLSAFWKELACAHQPSLAVPRRSQNETAARVRQMLSFLEAHFTEPLTLAEIAEAAHISPRECLRSFDRIIGMPPVAYLLRRRILYAAELLRETELPVTEVCFRAGFHSPSYFGKQFREQMGCTPRAFRQNRPAGTACAEPQNF